MTADETRCQRIGRLLAAGSPIEDRDDIAHVRRCDECKQRSSAAGLMAVPAPSGELPLEEVKRAIAGERGPLGWLRSRSRGLKLVVLALLALLATAAQLLNMRADVAAYPTTRMVAVLALLALTSLAAWRLGLRPLYQPPPGRARLVALLAALLFVPILVAAIPEASTGHPASQGGAGADLLPRALACFLYGTAFALPIIGLGALIDRSALRQPHSALAAIAAPALVGNLVLQVHCALTHPAHLLLGHASIAGALVIVGGGVFLLRRARIG